MNQLQQLRNVGISAHIDSGKTTLTERMLYYCGRIHAMHEVHGRESGATMDSDPIERKRGITIASAATRVNWNDHVINVIDTPGHVDFTVEVERSLRVLDGAVLVLSGVEGVQSQSLTVDRQMRRYGVPRIAFINKLDRAGANPTRVIDQLRNRLGANAVAVQIPIGCEDGFVGVVDLVTMHAVYFDGDYGQIVRRELIPETLEADAMDARAQMLDALAMLDESLMQTVISGEDPATAEIQRVLRQATIQQQLTPVLMGSAYKNKGVQEVLDAITLYLPSPGERRIFAIDQESTDQKPSGDESNDGVNVELSCDSSQPLVAMAFKTVVEKYGQLTYLRIYQGSVQRGCSYQNARTGKSVRLSRLVRLHANQREEIDEGNAGDIIGVFGVDCASGDTLVDDGCKLTLENIVVADPVIRLSIAAVRREDADKLSKALDRFRREDPTFKVISDSETGETLIAGMGQLHLDVYVERLLTEYECACEVSLPQVAYKETPSRSVTFDHRLKKMTGGPGLFAHIRGHLEVLPIDSEASFVFEDQITGGRIDRRYVPAVRDGFAESLAQGPIGRFEVVGVKVVLEDVAQHEQESSELAFKLCASQAMRNEILPRADVVLLEPVMRLDVDVPEHYLGAVTGHIARKRGTVISTESLNGVCEVSAEVPLAELFDYANKIRSMTRGEGTFTMEPCKYQRAPASVQNEVAAARAVDVK